MSSYHHNAHGRFGIIETEEAGVFLNTCLFCFLSVHSHQKLVVVVGMYQASQHCVHGLYRIHLTDNLADDPHSVKRSLILKQVIPTRT